MRSRRLSRRGDGEPDPAGGLALVARALLAVQRRRQLLHANGQHGSLRRRRGGGQGAAREHQRAQHARRHSVRKRCQIGRAARKEGSTGHPARVRASSLRPPPLGRPSRPSAEGRPEVVARLIERRNLNVLLRMNVKITDGANRCCLLSATICLAMRPVLPPLHRSAPSLGGRSSPSERRWAGIEERTSPPSTRT